jgi:hypothetical protein
MLAPDFDAEIDWGQTTKQDLLEAKARAQVLSLLPISFISPSARLPVLDTRAHSRLDACDLLALPGIQAQGEGAMPTMPPDIPLQVDPFKSGKGFGNTPFGNKPDSKPKSK